MMSRRAVLFNSTQDHHVADVRHFGREYDKLISALEAENRQQSSDISAMYDVLSKQGRDLTEAVELLRVVGGHIKHRNSENHAWYVDKVDAFLKRMEETHG
jgi:hypothetical protein